MGCASPLADSFCLHSYSQCICVFGLRLTASVPLLVYSLCRSSLQVIASVAWDSEKDRLAVLLRGDHPFAGHVLLYATVQYPVMSAICLGPLYLPQRHQPGQSGGERGAGTLAMLTGRPQGTLLGVRIGDGSVSVVPLAVGARIGVAASPPPARVSASLSGTQF